MNFIYFISAYFAETLLSGLLLFSFFIQAGDLEFWEKKKDRWEFFSTKDNAINSPSPHAVSFFVEY